MEGIAHGEPRNTDLLVARSISSPCEDDSSLTLLKEENARLKAENEALRQSQASKESLMKQSKAYGEQWYNRHMSKVLHESGVRPLQMQYSSIAEELEPFMTDETLALANESRLLATSLSIMERWDAAYGAVSPATIFRVARMSAGEDVSLVAKEAVARGFDDFDTLASTPANELGRFYDIDDIENPTCVYAFFAKISREKLGIDVGSSKVFHLTMLRLRTQFSFKREWRSFIRRCAHGDFSGSSTLITRYDGVRMPDIGGSAVWPLLLIEDDGSHTFCYMFHANIFHHNCPLLRSWAVRDLLMLKNEPLSKILVDPKSGILIWQNPASCSLFGAHGLENCHHFPGQEQKPGLNFLALLFERQEELKQEMLSLVKTGELFNERMEIKSPELKRLLGFSPQEPLWHRVFATEVQEPFSLDATICIVQVDETAIVLAEKKVKTLHAQQQSLLQEILPQQVTDTLLARLAKVSAQRAESEMKWANGTTRPTLSLSRQTSSCFPELSRQNLQDLATSHDEVSILFADIKGFTSLSTALHPSQVMLLLNDLFHKFDDLLERYDVYKVETIGDCYVVAAGLFDRTDEVEDCILSKANQGLLSPFPYTRQDRAAGDLGKLGGRDPYHAHKLLRFALALSEAAAEIENPLDGGGIEVRIGIHSGPVYSGVVGRKMPRFCLFGDTVNTASRMESNGEAGRIHVSAATAALLHDEDWEERIVNVKGKGEMFTYFNPQAARPASDLSSETDPSSEFLFYDN